MKNNSTRKEKLRNYSIVAGSVAAAATGANAQVMYTDVNPDATVGLGQTYNLDLNATTVDFVIAVSTISQSFITGTGAGMVTGASNGIVGIASSGSGFSLNLIDTLTFGTTIDNTNTYVIGGSTSSAPPALLAANTNLFDFGSWLGANNMYAGLKFMIGSNTHYGWVRMSVDANVTQVTIKDYAYEATAGEGILAGDNNTSVETNLRDEVDMFISNGQLVVSPFNNTLTNGMVTVTNLQGQVVATFAVNGRTSFDMSAFAAGMYVISATFDQGVAVEKLFVR